MGKTLYICKSNGDVFEYFPEHEESSELLEANTSYIFTAFHGTKDKIEAFACGYNVTKYDLEQSGSSDSSDSVPFLSSESSLSEGEGEGSEDDIAFYVVRKEDGSEYSTLSCYSIYGEMISEFELQISEEILGMEVWPKDGNTVVITSANNIYIINLKSGIPSIVFSESVKKLTKGIAYKSGSGGLVSFWVGIDEGEFCKRAEISINKYTADNHVVIIYGTKISREILGFTNYFGRVFIAFPQTELSGSPKTYIWDPSGSKSITIPISCIDIASATSACSYLYPYKDEYLEIETIEYDPETGDRSTSSNLTTFGVIASGGVSVTKVIRLNVPWAKSIKNIRLGLTDSSLLHGFSPGILKFGTSPTFIPSYQPSEDFEGINDTDTSDDDYNKIVNNSSYPNGKISDYVYLTVSLPERYFGAGHFQLKWFFDVEVYEEDQEIIPTKICPDNEESFSSESTLSSDFVCEAGTQYLNDAVDPIVLSGGVYSWDGGQWDTNTQRHANIRHYCSRILVYDNVYHNGIYYVLNTPSVVTPWGGGIAVPDRHPFVTPCWDYSTFKGTTMCTPPRPWSLGDVGLSTTFTINPRRLYQNLIDENGLDIPIGALHSLSLEIDTWALEARTPREFIVQGRIIINPKAYYHRAEQRQSNSSDSSESCETGFWAPWSTSSSSVSSPSSEATYSRISVPQSGEDWGDIVKNNFPFVKNVTIYNTGRDNLHIVGPEPYITSIYLNRMTFSGPFIGANVPPGGSTTMIITFHTWDGAVPSPNLIFPIEIDSDATSGDPWYVFNTRII